MGNSGITAVFLQVRLQSTRLPQKALIKLAEKTVIEHAMEALRLMKADIFALLTDYASGEALKPYAEKCGFEVFSGSEFDVLSRFAMAARKWKPDRIVRATGDNPLVSWTLADRACEIHEKRGADFCGLLGMPLGTGVEVLKAKSLLAADKEATDPYEREHVSPFLYFRRNRFSILRPYAPAYALCDVEVTLDTPEDYQFISRIYEELYHNEPISVERLVQWLLANPQYWPECQKTVAAGTS